jgi:hypothetical protein
MILEQCFADTEDVPENGAVNKTIAPVHKRRQLWEKIFSKQFRILRKVAVQCFCSMHATSCASERNLSVFGALHDKSCNRLKLERAQKVVFLNVNEGIKKKLKLVIEEDFLPFALNNSDAEDDAEEVHIVAEDAGPQQVTEGGDNEPATV